MEKSAYVKLKTCDWTSKREQDENMSCPEEMLVSDRINRSLVSQEDNILGSAVDDKKVPAKAQVFLQVSEKHRAEDEQEM